MFKSLLMCFALISGTSLGAQPETAQTEKKSEPFSKPYSFEVISKKYRFSKMFELRDATNNVQLTAKKSWFRFRTNYDLYKRDGSWDATATKRVLSLGFLFTWASEFDVWGSDGSFLGMIDGQIMTTARARFSIYDRSENLIGVAFIDQSGESFTVNDPHKETVTIASGKRNVVERQIDRWTFDVLEPQAIDHRLIRMLAIFAADKQSYFKADR